MFWLQLHVVKVRNNIQLELLHFLMTTIQVWMWRKLRFMNNIEEIMNFSCIWEEKYVVKNCSGECYKFFLCFHREKREKDELEITEIKRDLSISQREQERIAKELSETVNMYQVIGLKMLTKQVCTIDITIEILTCNCEIYKRCDHLFSLKKRPPVN